MTKWFKDELSKNWKGQDINNYPTRSIIYFTDRN